MSFDVIFTKAAESVVSAPDDLPKLEERTRDEIAELPGEGVEALKTNLFHAFALEDGTAVICSLTANDDVRVDACAVASA